MRSLTFLLLGLLDASAVFALSGTVKDGQGAPIPGASLWLSSAPGAVTVSDAQGRFSLPSVTSVRPGSESSSSQARIQLEGNRLQLPDAASDASATIQLVSEDGRSVPVASSFAMAGARSYLLPPLGAGVYLVRCGNAPALLAKLVHAGNDWLLAPTSPPDRGPDGFSPREAAVLDTLVTQKAGYVTSRMPVSSHGQVVEVVLDPAGAVARSAGCGKARTLANGTLSLQSAGKARKYILGVPASYDKSQAYRLVFAFAESGSSAQSVANRNFFRMGGYDTKNTIFVAPEAENGAGSWSKADVGFTDDILAQVEGDLCIDKSRVFATGFSFGGAMSLALACTRADVFRGVAFFSGADLTGSCPTTLTKPIAYYASQASGDASGTPTPMPTSGRIKQAEFAKVNGCTAEPNATVFPASGQAHTCTVYKNCSAGHPTVYCTFNGPHGWEPTDPGQGTSWDPPEAWKFITQF